MIAGQPILSAWISAILTTIIAVIGLILVQILRSKLRSILNRIPNITPERNQQLYTLLMVGTWALSITIILVAVSMVLSLWVDITPLITGMGVIGLALGLGSQTIVKDFLGGIFILLENQYGVGDVIKVNSVSGEVEAITLRVTQLRDRNGQLHIIPNGDIRVVTNLTREWSRAIINIEIAFEENLERALEVLNQNLTQICENADLKKDLQDTPEIIGPLGVESDTAVLQIWAKTTPGRQWHITQDLQRRLHIAFRKAGIHAKLSGATQLPE